jgi:hypothetical protein
MSGQFLNKMTLAEYAHLFGIPHDDRKRISKASEKSIGPMLARAAKAILENNPHLTVVDGVVRSTKSIKMYQKTPKDSAKLVSDRAGLPSKRHFR